MAGSPAQSGHPAAVSRHAISMVTISLEDYLGTGTEIQGGWAVVTSLCEDSGSSLGSTKEELHFGT